MFCTYQGYTANDSDIEWDSYILRRYGEIAAAIINLDREEGDNTGLNVAAILYDTFGFWKDIQADLGAREVPREEHVVGALEYESNSDFSNDDNLLWDDPDVVDKSLAANYMRVIKATKTPLFDGSIVSCLEAINIMKNQ